MSCKESETFQTYQSTVLKKYRLHFYKWNKEHKKLYTFFPWVNTKFAIKPQYVLCLKSILRYSKRVHTLHLWGDQATSALQTNDKALQLKL